MIANLKRQDEMKYISRNILIFSILAAAGCSGLDSGEAIVRENEDIIKIFAEYPAATRATSNAFEAGDRIGLYAVEYADGAPAPLQVGGNYLNNEAFSFDGSQWTSERDLYWSSVPCDFYAYYPKMEITSVDRQIFEVALDQSSEGTEEVPGGYESSDLLWAKAENVSQEDGAVRLQFKHLMSRLVIKIVKGEKFEGELPENISVHIYNTVTSAMVDLEAGNLEKYPYGTKNTITARQVSSDTFEAVVVPQNIEKRTPLVELTMDGIAYLLDYSLSFRPGYQHTVTVVVNTSPDQEKIEISIDGSIEDW